MEINAPYQKDLSFSLMQPPMEYTCARAALFDAHALPESLLHQQLEQHRPLESCCAEYSDLHHHHQHYRHHYQQQPPQLHHPRYSPAVGEVMATESNPLPFDALSHHEKEKQGLPQNVYANQYGSTNVQALYKLREDALIPDRTYEDPHFFPKTCEDAHTPPIRRDTLQFACEERYQPQSPTRGSVSQFVREERYQPPQSPTRGEERYQPPQSPARGSLSFQPRIKLLCSIGGKIMARPVDGKLRYCGGETRVIAVDRGISFVELIGKMTQIYGSPLILKYQLPGEDLDALVSVSSDDDLQNMLDEYDKLVASSGDSRLRLFLFNSPLQCEILSHCDIGHGREDCCAEVMQCYIDAINGLANNGLSELVAEVHLENGFNEASAHHRIPLDLPNTTAPGPYFSAKHSIRIPSAPSSAPSSPSIASRQAHYKQCGTGETCPQFAKDQPSCIPPMNGLDMSKQEASQDKCVDTSSTLNRDHPSHIPLLESTRMQHDATISRGDTKWVKENGTHFVDPQDLFVHHYGRQRGTGSVFVDTWRNTWHDIQKPSGLTNPQSEAHYGNHPSAQPLTLFTRQGPVEDDFGRVEAVQHGHSEGHKQLPVFLHQPVRQAISPLHCDSLTRLQRGPGYESSYQNIDGQGFLPSLQGSGHPYGHNAHVSGTISMSMMGSAPSSPRDAVLGRCCCYRQRSQVHRGISVSLGEHSHSKRPSHFGDQSSRKHGLPLLSRFCDGSNFFTDSATGHCQLKLDKGYGLDDQDLLTSSRKHIVDRGSTRCHLAECHAKESGARYSDSHGFMEALHGHYERSMYQCGYADYNDQKGQHVEKARGFPVSTEFQAHWGERVAHLGSNEIENANVRTAGNIIHKIPVQDHINIEVCKEGCMGLHSNHAQEELEMGIRSMHDGGGVSVMESLHVSQDPSMLGHNELDFDLNVASFSSMDAVAGSLSRPSLEPPVWVDSPPFAAKDEYLKMRDAGTVIPAVDCDESSPGMHTGDSCRSPSFSCMESYAARGRSTSTSGDSGEPRVEHLPVSSLIHLPNMHSLDKGSTLYAHGSHPDIDHSGALGPSQPFPSRIVDSVTFDGASVTLASPKYDQSPVSSVNKANFSFAQSEHGPGVNGINADEEAMSQICATEQVVTDRNTSIINPYSNDDGEHQEIVKGDDDTVPNKIFERETKPVSEESRSCLEPLSTQLSTQAAAYANVQLLKIIPMVPSTVTCEIVQEVKVESGSLCPKEEEKELPATQAEAEAIARGLQIIKNDDLEDLKELGSGTYGTVFHGKWRGSDVAIKRIKASCFMGHPSVQERLISDFWREAGTLSHLHHPNIVAFYGVVPDGPGGTLATVTEYMVNGSLKQVLLKKDRTIDRKKRLLIAMDAAFGMEYLHSKKIVHFDLKSENLLVNMRDAHRPVCKVGDFGLSKVKHQTLVSGGVRGTLPWMAPELLSGKSLVTEKVDVFSFGIVMWELLTGEEPYANMHCGTIIGGIVNDTLRPVIPSWCDPSWRDLMERCWSGNPADRPDFSVVANELRAIAVSMNVK